MMVPCHALNDMHLTRNQCTKGAERKHRGMVEEYLRESLERSFQTYREPLETVTMFKYLGRVMIAGGRQLASGGGQPEKGLKKLETDD